MNIIQIIIIIFMLNNVIDIMLSQSTECVDYEKIQYNMSFPADHIITRKRLSFWYNIK